MNIQITPNFYNHSVNRQKAANNNTNIIYPNLKTLSSDTVSFSGKNRISDFVAKGVSDNMERLERIATTYLDVLESVAGKLKDDGVSFDRAYCELHPVKSPESYTSKITRSGSFKVPDAIRATLYMKNPYDLSILNDKLLPEMKKRGYILADVEFPLEEMYKRSYPINEADKSNKSKIVKIPDLDIRLEDAGEKRHLLSPNLRYCISKPQKSGYEDIQMRFIREFDKKKNPLMHELIILFGPNYALAKHTESEKIYSHLRQFDELHLKFDELAPNQDAVQAKRYIDLIRQMFRGKVSEKLFMNAKNKDLYEISEEIPIHFSQTDAQMNNAYFAVLLDKLNSCYKELKAAAKASMSATKQLNTDAHHDRTLIAKIQEALKETMAYFNHLDDLKHEPN